MSDQRNSRNESLTAIERYLDQCKTNYMRDRKKLKGNNGAVAHLRHSHKLCMLHFHGLLREVGGNNHGRKS